MPMSYTKKKVFSMNYFKKFDRKSCLEIPKENLNNTLLKT